MMMDGGGGGGGTGGCVGVGRGLDMMCNKIRITRVLWIGTTGPRAQYVVDCLPVDDAMLVACYLHIKCIYNK